jgi:polyisoprenoid-binding protein YceI
MRIKLELFLTAMFCAAAQQMPIDVNRSTITIHTFKAGFLAAASHEHLVNAPIAAGSIDEAAQRVEFRVDASKMKIKPDPKIDAKTEAEIQKDMQDAVLESAKFPEIAFRSTHVEKSGDAWKVDGSLSLHGMTRPVSVVVRKSGDAYTGKTTIKQTDFGIKPVSKGGGAVKVKDEIEIAFEIFR